jgi:site-specific recombinase XerD
LAVKRAAGCKFANEDRTLRLLDHFLVREKVNHVSAVDNECLKRFLAARRRDNPRSHNQLLGVVRRLFEWLVDQQIILTSPLRLRPRRETARETPLLFDNEVIRKLIAEAARLPDNSRARLRGPTFETIFALLAGLGLRISEVARLECGDVDLDRDVLQIRDTKFGKSRLVPFGPRLHARLETYLEKRAQIGLPHVGSAPLFSWQGTHPISTNTIRNVFREDLLPKMQIVIPPGTFGPRVHGLRHSFAVRTLSRWYREGVDPATKLNHLSTILGHVNPAATAVYLTITSDLFQEANRRFEMAAPSVKEVIS